MITKAILFTYSQLIKFPRVLMFVNKLQRPLVYERKGHCKVSASSIILDGFIRVDMRAKTTVIQVIRASH
jgi:hypothetical protein